MSDKGDYWQAIDDILHDESLSNREKLDKVHAITVKSLAEDAVEGVLGL